MKREEIDGRPIFQHCGRRLQRDSSRKMYLARYQTLPEESGIAHLYQSAFRPRTNLAQGLSFEEKIATTVVSLKITYTRRFLQGKNPLTLSQMRSSII